MKAWICSTLGDGEQGTLTSGKSVVLHGTRAEVQALARFLAEVAEHLETADYCHMHLRDSTPEWSESDDVDFEITVDERA